jgi:prolipoprotein diacylglyceryltransferase
VLWALDRRAWKPGTLVLVYGMTYGPLRFFLDFFRPEVTDARYFGFTPGQYGAALLTAVCIAGIVARSRSADEPVRPVYRPAPTA